MLEEGKSEDSHSVFDEEDHGEDLTSKYGFK